MLVAPGESMKIAAAILVVSLGLVLAIGQRHHIMLAALSSDARPALLDPADEGPGVRWHDDYFTVQAFDANTFAIGEPRYPQQNFNYLIVGEERAVLFDAGPGMRDIRPLAAALTDRPITFVPSHFHYDHVGNDVTFERVAVVDLPHLRARAPDDRLQLTADEHLGAAEGLEAPTLAVSEWLEPDRSSRSAGGILRVLYTPGHTVDSISLFDRSVAISSVAISSTRVSSTRSCRAASSGTTRNLRIPCLRPFRKRCASFRPIESRRPARPSSRSTTSRTCVRR
jgi:hypothetical protein